MNNKKKLFLGIAGVGLLGLVGAGAGLLNNVNAVETKAAGEIYNYRGTETGWNAGETVTEGGAPVEFTFVEGEEFKFAIGNWESSLGAGNVKGTAAAYFSGDDNIYCDVAGTYDVSIAGSTIYIDLQDGTNFYYSGSTNEWSDLSAKPIELNGDAVNFDLSKNEKFKIKTGEGWKIALGSESLASDYYKCFGDVDTGHNVLVNYTFSYDVSVISKNHVLSLNIVAHNPISNTVYVLDLYGDLLNNSHKAHYFNATIQTNWAGVDMPKVSETNGVYSVTYWNEFTTVIFNQIGDGEKTGQTIDLALTGNENKCLILNHDVNNELKWNSNTWISLAAAQFIDQKMHFGDYNEDQYKTEPTANCASYYGAAKTAYNALASNAVRKEVLSIEVVKDRLSWWATANGDTLDVADGTALPVAGAGSISGTINNSSMNIGVIAAIIATAVISTGSYFIIKKKHEN